jgi:hypothetical protein
MRNFEAVKANFLKDLPKNIQDWVIRANNGTLDGLNSWEKKLFESEIKIVDDVLDISEHTHIANGKEYLGKYAKCVGGSVGDDTFEVYFVKDLKMAFSLTKYGIVHVYNVINEPILRW